MELTVEKLIYGGDGLARLLSDDARAKTVFVPFVLPGERVEAIILEERRSFARAKPDRILQPSASRSEAPCPYFGKCGGCQYQHIEYEAQLRFKSDILRETLRRTAKIDLKTEVHLHSSPPLQYRNRTRFHVRHAPEFAIGYFRQGSHELLPVRECPISSPQINRALSEVWELGESGAVPEEIAEIEVFANASGDQLLVELYLRSQPTNRGSHLELARKLRASLEEIAGVAAFITSRSRTGELKVQPCEVLSGKTELKYEVAGEIYRVSVGAFFQTNRFLLPQIVELVIGSSEGRQALDLYSGVGLFAVPLAKRYERVVAVESSPVSANDMRANVPANVKVSAQSAQGYLSSVAGTLRPDLIVADPPRTGLGESVCAQLNKLSAHRITYLSCDPATLARDLKLLTAGGWQISEVHLLDLFPQTFHIETCVMLQR